MNTEKPSTNTDKNTTTKILFQIRIFDKNRIVYLCVIFRFKMKAFRVYLNFKDN